jgi:hypothetical protein
MRFLITENHERRGERKLSKTKTLTSSVKKFTIIKTFTSVVFNSYALKTKISLLVYCCSCVLNEIENVSVIFIENNIMQRQQEQQNILFFNFEG